MSKKESESVKVSRITTREVIRRYGARHMLVFFLIALFFTVLIIIYNTFLSSYVKQSIITRNELNAVDSAQDVEMYISTGTDVIEVSEYNIDEMLGRGASEAEILDYLTYKTNTVQNSILPATTGLYGCINGHYLDGSGWIPEEGYDPMDRPWYTEAIADRENIVLINPYYDMYSGEVVMTVAKALSNGKDVIAIDITLGRIQEIISEGTDSESGISRMIVSSNGFVVAHTDPDEVGKNYLDDKYTLGGFILQKISRSENDFHEIRYLGDDYIVYSVPIGKDWSSISIADSNRIFRPVRILLLASGSAILLTYVIFTLMMLRSGRKTIETYNLQKILDSSADIYISLCELDVLNNTATGIKNKNPVIAKMVAESGNNMQEVFYQIMNNLPESVTKQAAIDFADLSTIDERMKNTDSIALEYLSYGNIWVRARYVVSERTPDGRVSHLLWMLEDIDREKKERDNLIDMSERAWAASEAKSAFLSSMSHEIRTPINAILGLNEMVIRESNDEGIRDYARKIKSAGRTLLGIVNDILDFSKIESGKMEIIPVEYEVSSVINDLANMVRARTESKGLELIFDIDRNIPNKLIGDDVRIRQVITNLLTNAVKYTNEGSVTFSVSFKKRDEKSIVLSVMVKDTGLGIKKDDLKKLFSEFERIDEKVNRNVEGTGLGMSITKRLLELMGSSIKVESEYGKGSQFSFDVVQEVADWEPVGDYEESYKKSQDEAQYRRTFTAPSAKILLVEDNQVNILVFKNLLKDTELNIDTALSGDEGIELALKNKYDIIFLDHMMPDKDGIETLQELQANSRNLNRDTPFICLTANAVSGAKKTYMEAGFDDYLSKPVDPIILEKMIVSYLPEEKVNTDEA